MGIAPHCERLKIAHHDFLKVVAHEAPLYERFNSVHHGFMGAWEIRISNFWVVEKCAQRWVKVIKTMHLLCMSASTNVHHGFVTALKNAHRLFMSLSKISSTIYEIHKNMYFLCVSASTMPITALWWPLKMRIALLWVFQKFTAQCVKIIKTCISVVGPLEPA